MQKTALWLTVIGGLNWGLVGIGMFLEKNWNVVDLITMDLMWLEAIIYIVVGISAVILAMGGSKKSVGSSMENSMNTGTEM